MIRSRRLLEESERRLSEALMIVLALSDEMSADSRERDAWASGLESSVRALSDVRSTLLDLLGPGGRTPS